MKIIFKISLFATLLFFTNVAISQKIITVNFLQLDTSEEHIPYFDLLKPYSDIPYQNANNYRLLDTITRKVNRNFLTKCVYDIQDTSICLIGDGFGHPSFVIPGDEITLQFRRLPKKNGRFEINGKYLVPYFNSFNYEGKNKYTYELFDSLSYNTGSIFMGDGVNLKTCNYNLIDYFKALNQEYKQKSDFISSYSTRHKLPWNIKQLAQTEANANYVDGLLAPLANIVHEFNLADYPEGYIDSLKKFNLNDGKSFFRTISYNNVVFKYYYLFESRQSLSKEADSVRFTNTYNAISTKCSDPKMREYLLAAQLISRINKDFDSFEVLLSNFNEQFPSSTFKKHIDSLYIKHKENNKISLTEALNSEISDQKNSNLTLKQIVGLKPIVIDCWASWCMPCLEQMPFSKRLEKKYDGKILFIYLSFDKANSIEVWKKKSTELNLGSSSYLLKDNFKSLLARHFNLSSIPRYIVIDKDGQVINDNAPRPSKEAILSKLLDKLIK